MSYTFVIFLGGAVFLAQISVYIVYGPTAGPLGCPPTRERRRGAKATTRAPKPREGLENRRKDMRITRQAGEEQGHHRSIHRPCNPHHPRRFLLFTLLSNRSDSESDCEGLFKTSRQAFLAQNSHALRPFLLAYDLKIRALPWAMNPTSRWLSNHILWGLSPWRFPWSLDSATRSSAFRIRAARSGALKCGAVLSIKTLKMLSSANASKKASQKGSLETTFRQGMPEKSLEIG